MDWSEMVEGTLNGPVGKAGGRTDMKLKEGKTSHTGGEAGDGCGLMVKEEKVERNRDKGREE